MSIDESHELILHRNWISPGSSQMWSPLRKSLGSEFWWTVTTYPSTCRAVWRKMKRGQPLTYFTLLPIVSSHFHHSKPTSESFWFALQVEPFFVSLSLFDIQSGRKISSDFHVDMNHPSVKVLLPPSGAHNSTTVPDSPQGAQPTANSLTESAIQFPRQVRTHKTRDPISVNSNCDLLLINTQKHLASSLKWKAFTALQAQTQFKIFNFHKSVTITYFFSTFLNISSDHNEQKSIYFLGFEPFKCHIVFFMEKQTQNITNFPNYYCTYYFIYFLFFYSLWLSQWL